MRIFVGIKIRGEMREEILKWQSKFQITNNKLQTNHKSEIQNSVIRFIKPKNLHLTLVPPLEVEEKDLQAISDNLKVMSFEPFEIKFSKIEFGPDVNCPRLIWTMGKAILALIKLKGMIYSSLTSLKLGRNLYLSKEKREYMHCTVARIKKYPTPGLRPFQGREQTMLLQDVSWSMLVDRFVLYESKLLPEGAEYEVLEEFPLSSQT